MQISERPAGDVMIVDVSGKITLGDGGDVMLKDKMQSLIQQGKKKVLLNLGDVSYVDSAGLARFFERSDALTLQPVTRDVYSPIDALQFSTRHWRHAGAHADRGRL